MPRVHTSRRVSGLRPTDYDHEIVLLDHDGAADQGARTPTDEGQILRVTTESQLLPNAQRPAQQSSSRPNDSTDNVDIQERPTEELAREQELPHEALRPSIEIQGI